jgi:phage tail P2-like protein
MNSLLPPNASPQERAIEQSAERLGAVDVPVGKLWDPKSCPVSLLPWLAWALSVDEWRSDWPESTKRAVVAASLGVHAHKGTVWALRRALEAAGYPQARIAEWFETAGAPYTGTVHIDLAEEVVGGGVWARLIRLVERYKNARSHIGLRLSRTISGATPLYAAALTSGERVEILPRHTPLIEASGAAPMLGMAVHAGEVATVWPHRQYEAQVSGAALTCALAATALEVATVRPAVTESVQFGSQVFFYGAVTRTTETVTIQPQ